MNDREIPVAEVALRLSITRERAIRLITSHQLRGGQRQGKWFATAQSVEELVGQQRREAQLA